MRNDPRVTRRGPFLRNSSLDELPQLINGLRGEMSLVGPRPIVDAEMVKYGRRFRYYASVKPGITGWAQVNGRNALSWDEKFKLDVWYVDHHNLWLDIKILLLTVKKVFIKEGISAQNDATMPFFTGNDDHEKK